MGDTRNTQKFRKITKLPTSCPHAPYTVYCTLFASMDHRRISPDLKQCALQLLDQKMSPRAIAEVLGVSAKSIECWRVDYEQYGCVAPPGALLGRPHLLTTPILEE
ncbi:hypothetical protein P691DRAFT_846648 [Macrolepiota fuliginosa MF-IS2]|uniref:Uncharacterized protein n=1 Tax=Macrolepiota fuliginosa MF-IS2 TaxID=1400762 RepID=A0A9P6C645_9AGAR|nr:hypothetical protein P691DRAFT_846648 [Macrolepiota fuliginosa MF-IS2]